MAGFDSGGRVDRFRGQLAFCFSEPMDLTAAVPFLVAMCIDD